MLYRPHFSFHLHACVAQPSDSAGSDDYMNSKKRSSFLGRPLKELEDLW